MTEARLKITFAGPLVSLQDAGRMGAMRYGVSPSGPMDRLAFAAAHAALGNPEGGTAIEVSLGGVSLVCEEQSLTIAISGGDFVVDHNGVKSSGWQVITLHPNDRLSLRAGASGSWSYIAVVGTISASVWMGSTARHSKTHLGGQGLAAGTKLSIADPQVRDTRLGMLPAIAMNKHDPIRVVLGPQDHHFTPASVETFLNAEYKVSSAYDRMGMRLNGPELTLDGALSIPSEPVLRGAVQVSGDGVPTVLLADHQSTGGYPKMATVLSCDTDRLSQMRAGESVRFVAIPFGEAVPTVREIAKKRRTYLETLDVPRGSLEQRLMRENLIYGFNIED